MDDHIAIIEDKPAFLRAPFYATFFLVFLLRYFQHAFGERVEHAVTGAVTDNKVISKGCDVLDVEEQDVFALSVL